MSQKRIQDICAAVVKAARDEDGKKYSTELVTAAMVVEQLEIISDALWEIRDELSGIKGRSER